LLVRLLKLLLLTVRLLAKLLILSFDVIELLNLGLGLSQSLLEALLGDFHGIHTPLLLHVDLVLLALLLVQLLYLVFQLLRVLNVALDPL